MFREITFDERFGRLMVFAPLLWLDFNVIVSISMYTLSVLHLNFFLRDFLKIPLENIRLRERSVFFEAPKVAGFLKKKVFARK